MLFQRAFGPVFAAVTDIGRLVEMPAEFLFKKNAFVVAALITGTERAGTASAFYMTVPAQCCHLTGKAVYAGVIGTSVGTGMFYDHMPLYFT